MNNAAARCHPLNIAGLDLAPIPDTVAVLNGASQHISDRLDPAVRMPREPFQIVIRNVIPEVVKEEKGVELFGISESEGTMEVNSGTFQSRGGLSNLLDGANGHRLLFIRQSSAGTATYG